jgi:hypothetical protein
MDLYQYIAQNNPDGAIFVCRKYGYGANVNSVEELAYCCRNMVAAEGEAALVDLLKNHPDKEILLELFSQKKKDSTELEQTTNQNQYSPNQNMNATGSDNAGNLVNMTNTYILASAIIIAFAIFSIKK